MDKTVTEVQHQSEKHPQGFKCVMNKTFGTCYYEVRSTYHGCRYRNGGCEHFCRQFPNRSHLCFCANGYRLDRDNSTCVPQGLWISNFNNNFSTCGLLALNHEIVFLIQLKWPVEDNWYISPQGLSMAKYAPKDTVHGRWETGYVFNRQGTKQCEWYETPKVYAVKIEFLPWQLPVPPW